MSLDANFGLVHKKNSGVSVEEPQIASQVFLKREEVIEFMDNYQDSQTKTKVQTCKYKYSKYKYLIVIFLELFDYFSFT